MLIVINLTWTLKKCPDKIIYRYIPRTFEEQQNEPDNVSNIFRKMFVEQSPWVGNLNDVDTRKQDSINRYFISQI